MSFVTDAVKDKTATQIRAITPERVKKNFPNDIHKEKILHQLSRLADEKELVELKEALPKAAIKKVFPKAVIRTRRVRKCPCILIYPNGKPELEEGEDNE